MRFLKYIFKMIPVIWAFIKDLIFEDLSFDEIKTNYLFGKANAYDHSDMFKRSIKIYESILKNDQNSIPALLNLGGVYFRKGMFEKAIPFYERVIRLNPKNYQGHYWLAMCYRKLKRYYAAINTLEEIIEYLPTFKDALNLIGECYERVGDGAKAEHYYLKAISVDPESIIVQRGVLNNLSRGKKHEERIKH